MTATHVLNREDLHRAVDEHLAPVIAAIGASIGPEGRATVYNKGARVLRAQSGVEIARRCVSDVGAGGVGQVLLREMMIEAERDLGDGTARLAVMAAAALRAGQRSLAAGIEPGMLAARIAAMTPEIRKAFTEVTSAQVDTGAILDAACLSTEVRNALREALRLSAGPEQIELRISQTCADAVSAQKGFVWDAQSIGQKPLDTMDDVSLIVADDIITDFRNLAPVIEGFAAKRKALVIAARGVGGDALAFLERNRMAGVLTVATLKPYDEGPRAAVILEDLAIATGAHLVAERNGSTLARLKPWMLGQAKKFQMDGTRVTLTEAAGEAAAVAIRLKEIEAEIKASRYLTLDLEHARRRNARLAGQWVEVVLMDRPGAQGEMEEARHTLASMGHALRGGVLAGGGAGLALVATRLLEKPYPDSTERAAREMVCAALRATQRHIARNSGHEYNSVPIVKTPPPDPAGLSHILLTMALSFATRLISMDRAILRVAER